MIRPIVLSVFLLSAVPAVAEELTVRVRNAAAQDDLQLFRLSDGTLREIAVQRSTDGPDALLTAGEPCEPGAEYVVRAPGSTSPLVTAPSCGTIDTELRSAATLVLTEVTAQWKRLDIQRCDERRPVTRSYPVTRQTPDRLEAIIEAGCLIPTLYADGAAPAPTARVTLAEGSATRVPSPAARKGGSLRVQVTRDGEPLQGVDVQIVDRHQDPNAALRALARETTDAHGEARLVGIAPGERLIGIRAGDELDHAYGEVYDVTAGELIQVELDSPPAATLLVQLDLSDELEETIREIQMTLERVDETTATPAKPGERPLPPPSFWMRPEGKLVEPGVWRWKGLQPGTWRVTATVMLAQRGFTHGLARADMTLQPGENRTVELEPLLGAVRGRVRTPARSLDRHNIRLEPFDRRDDDLTRTMVPIGEENRFVAFVAPGVYRYGYQPRTGGTTWFNEKVEVTTEGTDLIVDLPAGQISGRVVRADGRRAPQCSVSGSLMGAARNTVTHQPPKISTGTRNGDYRIEIVPAGTWSLTASCGAARSEPQIVAVGDSEVTNVNFEVSGDELFRGKIVNAAGQPLPRTPVHLLFATPADKGRRRQYNGMSDTSGNLVISLPPEAAGLNAEVRVFRNRGQRPVPAFVLIRQDFTIVVPD